MLYYVRNKRYDIKKTAGIPVIENELNDKIRLLVMPGVSAGDSYLKSISIMI